SDRVAIVTGAGGGRGRAYALGLARRGAKVVVNDLGGSRDGTGHTDGVAAVIEEIEAAGATAMADGSSVTDLAQVEAMVARAKAAWGGVHILINNAGILRDKSFAKMSMEDFKAVVDGHLIGSANTTHAVWETMREQAYGRILMTASSTGLYGNFGQANYGAAKLGLAGFAKTLALEGAKYNVRVNTIAPTAATRMTEDKFPPASPLTIPPCHEKHDVGRCDKGEMSDVQPQRYSRCGGRRRADGRPGRQPAQFRGPAERHADRRRGAGPLAARLQRLLLLHLVLPADHRHRLGGLQDQRRSRRDVGGAAARGACLLGPRRNFRQDAAARTDRHRPRRRIRVRGDAHDRSARRPADRPEC